MPVNIYIVKHSHVSCISRRQQGGPRNKTFHVVLSFNKTFHRRNKNRLILKRFKLYERYSNIYTFLWKKYTNRRTCEKYIGLTVPIPYYIKEVKKISPHHREFSWSFTTYSMPLCKRMLSCLLLQMGCTCAQVPPRV